MEGTINTNGNNEDEDFYQKMQRIQAKFFEQNELNTILEKSKNDYFKQVEKKLPEEPKEEEEYFSIRVKEKNGEDGYVRRFRPTDSIEDVKNFAKCKLRKNSDINMYSEKEKKLLYNTKLSIKDSGINKEDEIVIDNQDDL